MGEVFPVTEDQQHAWDGMVSAEISRLDDSENINLKEQFSRLLEMYIPIRHEGTERVIAVVEFYQTVEELEKNVGNAKRQSWLVVALTMLSAYGLLVGIVRQGHQTILKQQNDLNNKVEELNILLEKNSELSERVRRAASRTAALNERFMRRISAELHDGPAQDMSFSLLHIDNVASALDKDLEESKKGFYHKALDTIHQSLNRATQEIRNIASGLRLPELEMLSPIDIVERVIRDHERRTQSKVTIESKNLPKHLQVPLKVTLFRLIQEALTNAFRHGQGKEQKVKVDLLGQGKLLVEISDQGPGFNPKDLHEGRLGLMGMRERVESLGGTFEINSNPGQGTKVSVHLPLSEDLYE
jgi:signal transduction histidine kinase